MNRDRSHLRLIEGGRRDERDVRLKLYGQADRVVRAEPRPDPQPPKAAAA